MSDSRLLAQMGFVPEGTAQKRTTQQSLQTLADSIGKFVEDDRKRKEREQERKTKMYDSYKTLRDAGYEPKKAWEAVGMKDEGMPEPSGELSLKDQKTQADIAYTQARTDRVKSTSSTAKSRIPTQSGMQTTAIVDGDIVPVKPYHKEKAKAAPKPADVEWVKRLSDNLGKEMQGASGSKYRVTDNIIADAIAQTGHTWEDYADLGIVPKKKQGDFATSDYIPKHIKTTSEAVNHIMRQHGKTREEAIEELRQLQGK
jgi:hypothetical protein